MIESQEKERGFVPEDCLFWIKRLGALEGLGVQPSDWEPCRELSVGWMWEREVMSWGRLSRERENALVLYTSMWPIEGS